jgi:hypothetical protein
MQPGRQAKPGREDADNARTIRPIKSPVQSPNPAASEDGASISGKFPAWSAPTGLEAKEDYSADLDIDENAFSQKISRLRVRRLALISVRMWKTEDSFQQQSSTGQKRSSKLSNTQVARDPSPSHPLTPSKLNNNESLSRRPRLISPQSPLSRSTSRSNSFRGNDANEEVAKRTLSRLSKYAEVEDEGYDDVFIAEDEKRFGCGWTCF